MILEVRTVEPFHKNGFVVGCERTHEAVLIDPGDEVDQLVEIIHERKLEIRYILLTHAHIDHITGVQIAKDKFNVPIYLHRDDLFLYESVVQQGAMFGIHAEALPPIDRFYDSSLIHFGDYEVCIHHTPGHCPGGVCLQIGKKGSADKHLFVGDTLFAGSIGRTDLPGGDYEILLRSITTVIFTLGNQAPVHPGHGPDTTIERERATNPFVTEYLANHDL